ncbi:MAG: sigma-70 family RNA polymerase sigma factor [Clostridiales bacterium]|nr:sigma-70 family RNA polymerase sigma factor [Clostridiales bacterium]
MFLESLFEFIREAIFLFGHMVSKNSFPNALSAKEEDELLKRMSNGDKEARDKLIEHNMRLVVHVVKKFSTSRVEQDDLISIGSIGLIKAVNTYKYGHETRLATYAARCVENEVLMYLRSIKKLEKEVSLDEPVGSDNDGNELTNMDILGTDPDAVVYEVSDKIELKKILDAVNDTLNERERIVFNLRFGISGNEPLPQREVAKMLGISRSYVSRIEKKAIEKLRSKIGDEGSIY